MQTDNLSPFRQSIIQKLSTRYWFKQTSPELQQELINLPEDHNGFLADIADRPDEIGNLEVIKLKELKRGNYLLIPVFEVISEDTNQTFTHEYASSKYGRNPGFKGLILIEVNGKIEYFIIKQTTKFPQGSETYDSIGGFIQFTNGQLENLESSVANEIKRELGLESLPVKQFIDLGQMTTDISMTNNHTSLFTAIIDGNQVPDIQKLNNAILNTKKISFKVKIIPISELNQIIGQIDDSFFLACVARLAAKRVINL